MLSQYGASAYNEVMPTETYTLSVKTTGLSGREIEQLETILQSSKYVISSTRTYRTLDQASDGSFTIQASISTFHFILELKHPVITAASAVATVGGSAYVKAVAEELGKETVKWFKNKFTGKSEIEVGAIIGTDGKPLQKIKHKR